MTKFKVGDKVRVTCPGEFVPKGTVLTVKSGPEGPCGGGNYRFEEARGIILGKDIELVNAQPTKKQRISTLEAQVAELKAEVEALKQAQGKSADIGNTAAHLAKAIERAAQPTPNELRKAIIAEARAFVAETTAKMNNGRNKYEGNETYRYYSTVLEFHVNAEKRTATALVRGEASGKLREKAIAKCAPTDVFNADIGKAIALGRALGLDVSKFEQAVQPTKYANGQVITFPNTDSWHRRYNYRIDDVKATTGNLTKLFEDGGKANAGLSDPNGNKLEIIDDTEAQYD